MTAQRAALERMVYETTHLSPAREDGSHDCRISAEALALARAALSTTDATADLLAAAKAVAGKASDLGARQIAVDEWNGFADAVSDLIAAIARHEAATAAVPVVSDAEVEAGARVLAIKYCGHYDEKAVRWNAERLAFEDQEYPAWHDYRDDVRFVLEAALAVRGGGR